MQGINLGVSCFLYNRNVGLLVAPLAGIVTTPTVRLHGSWIARVPVETSSWPTLTTLGTDLLSMSDSETVAKGQNRKQYAYGGLRHSVYIAAEHTLVADCHYCMHAASNASSNISTVLQFHSSLQAVSNMR